MSLTKQLEKPLAFPSGPASEAASLQQAASRSRSSGVLVHDGSGARFSQGRVALAAPATKLVREDDVGTTLWLVMPGAGKGNTEVLWDAAAEQLHVGVWSKPVPEAPRTRAPRLLWHSQHWCPGADGARAVAQLARGWVMVSVPRRDPFAASSR